MPAASALRSLLATFSWQELRQHPWRNAAAVLAVMLGVALAFSVHLINASALSEFASAVRSVGGQPDLSLRGMQSQFDEALFRRVATHPEVAVASPVLEVPGFTVAGDGQRRPLRVVGIDALVVAAVAPGLMPVPAEDAGRMALFAPGTVFLNAAARQQAAVQRCADGPGDCVQLQSGQALRSVRIAGHVNAAGAPLAVMDIGAAQDFFGLQGRLSRIDLRLAPGTDHAALLAALQLPPDIQAGEPVDAALRIDNLSRAYRVNLTVLALVALFTGAFLVFSVLSLSVAKRAQQFALLGVLGLTGRERLQLVLWESLVLGSIGSLAGIALGTGLAAAALRLLGGDLGGGYFAGVAPNLQWDGPAALVYGGLGIAAALVGGWWPARQAQRLPPAQTLKGLGTLQAGRRARWLGAVLLLGGVLLALMPPLFGLPLAAYFAVALLLVGGISVLPWLIALLYDRLAPLLAHRLLPMLAVERARRVRESAAVAVSGVVASLSLAVALTVMVASFRDSVTQWLDVVLPADLYLRGAGAGGPSEASLFDAGFVQAVARLDGVEQATTLRVRSLQLDPGQPAVALLSRPIGADPAVSLPLVGAPLPVPAGQIGIYVSEPMVDLYGARPGTAFAPLSASFGTLTQDSPAQAASFFIAGVWRDYARQFGAIAMDRGDFERLTGDRSVSDIALKLRPGADTGPLQQAVRELAKQHANGDIEFTAVGQIRATSLRIFDRSFAVTYWLQAVAIGIGLFGVAASFSAQVLARRKEFGLLAHLGLTRRQILAVVASEGAAWTLIGSLAGLALGLAVAVVLVYVVNPQSFHWTMDLMLPWPRLVALCLAVVAAGTVTAWLAGRAAAGRDAVLAVKEDW
ncbi:ABC transporter permease [Rhodoferax koreense]|uniref:ABC transporter permease n=1 Tax=Rhodoferax koreensis TaxID=1842727 RepID=A0A1P8JY19_9BURK|nr:ABC transporter permease [Rhodoferax koreense]APW38652.1 ABC transporter permease [Rhodoferax koreense]